jgi:hypothetical protein
MSPSWKPQGSRHALKAAPSGHRPESPPTKTGKNSLLSKIRGPKPMEAPDTPEGESGAWD